MLLVVHGSVKVHVKVSSKVVTPSGAVAVIVNVYTPTGRFGFGYGRPK